MGAEISEITGVSVAGTTKYARQERYAKTEKGKEASRKARKRYKAKRRQQPIGKFEQQRTNARHRGIAWEFTFDQWWAIWEPHWEKRGTEKGQLVMGRRGDIGPYSAENVEIITNSENVSYMRSRQ